MSSSAAWTRAGIVSPLAVALLFAVPRLAQASDPTPPIQIQDDGASFRIPLGLSLPPSTLQVSAVYNRIAGTVVDAGAQTLNNVTVRRALGLQQDAQGGYFVDISPFVAGQPTPPNGIYSLWIEVHHTPLPGAIGRVPFTFRRSFSFRVIDGTAQRLSPGQYSALIDPVGARKDKLGQQEPVHSGFSAARMASGQVVTLPMVESGADYYSPDTSEAGQP